MKKTEKIPVKEKKKKQTFIIERDEYMSVRRTYKYRIDATSKKEAQKRLDNGDYDGIDCIDEDVYDFIGTDVISIQTEKEYNNGI